MYVVAVIGDILSLFPGLNIATGIVTGILLWIIGTSTGVNIFSGPNIGKTLLTLAVEETPVLSILPTWTVRVYFAKKKARAENAG